MPVPKHWHHRAHKLASHADLHALQESSTRFGRDKNPISLSVPVYLLLSSTGQNVLLFELEHSGCLSSAFSFQPLK